MDSGAPFSSTTAGQPRPLLWGGVRMNVLCHDQDEDWRRIERLGLDAPDWNPYFGQIWPSAKALTEFLCENGALVHRTRVLDLGCGAGVAGLFAARLGGVVTLADSVPDALALAKANARRNGLMVETMRFDIRDPRPVSRPYDLVLASDLLYERWQGAALVDALSHLVSDRGRALVADPMRGPADSFPLLAEQRGFRVTATRRAVGFDKRTLSVRVFCLVKREKGSWR